MESRAGELRVNLIRLVAIAAFYGHHLLNVHLLGVEVTADYHASVTSIAAIWALAGMAIHVMVLRRGNPPYLAYLALTGDGLLATTLLLQTGGPGSPLLIVLFLLIATAPLRMRLPAVWAATGLAILSYAILLGHAKWVAPDVRVPRPHQIIMVIALGCAGLLAGQVVRQAVRFARDYADRLNSKDPE